jgi:hypothetical protein
VHPSSTFAFAFHWFSHQFIIYLPLNLANALYCFCQTSLTHIFIIDEISMINVISLILVTLLSHACLSLAKLLLLTLLHHLTVTLSPFCFITLLIDEVHLFFLTCYPLTIFPLMSQMHQRKGVNPSSSSSTSKTIHFLLPMLIRSA